MCPVSFVTKYPRLNHLHRWLDTNFWKTLQQNRKFDKQFKKSAVKLILEEGYSVKEVSQELDVHANSLYRWVQEYSKVLYYLWKKKNRQSFYSCHGKWTKPISKLRDVGIIFIVQLMRTA